MPIIGLLNVVIERAVYRPLRNAPRLAPLITADRRLVHPPEPGAHHRRLGRPQGAPDLPVELADPVRRSPDLGAVDLHLRAGDGPDALAPGVRPTDAPGTGDARDGPGPRGLRPHGRRRQPDDRPDVPPRRRPGRGGRRRLGPAVRLRPVRPRLQLGPEGVHRGRAGRHRQHHGRGHRRVHHRVRGELLGGAGLCALVGVPRVHDPDPRPLVQADRHPRGSSQEIEHERRDRRPARHRPVDVAPGPPPGLRRSAIGRPRSSSRWASSPC